MEKADTNCYHVLGPDGFEASYHDEGDANSHAAAIGGWYEPGVVLASLPSWITKQHMTESERDRCRIEFDSEED